MFAEKLIDFFSFSFCKLKQKIFFRKCSMAATSSTSSGTSSDLPQASAVFVQDHVRQMQVQLSFFKILEKLKKNFFYWFSIFTKLKSTCVFYQILPKIFKNWHFFETDFFSNFKKKLELNFQKIKEKKPFYHISNFSNFNLTSSYVFSLAITLFLKFEKKIVNVLKLIFFWIQISKIFKLVFTLSFSILFFFPDRHNGTIDTTRLIWCHWEPCRFECDVEFGTDDTLLFSTGIFIFVISESNKILNI